MPHRKTPPSGERTFSGQIALEARRRGETKLDKDLLNAWTTAALALERPQRDFWDDLGPVLSFEEQVRSGGYSSEQAEEIIRGADPNRAVQYNALVAEFNADLQRMKTARDADVLRKFYDRAMALIKE